MTYCNIQNSIALYDKAVPDQLCDEVIDFYESNKHLHTQGKTAWGISDMKVSTDMAIASPSIPISGEDDYRVRTELDDYIADFMNGAVNNYISVFDWIKCANLTQDTGYQIQKYNAGEGHYKEHIDGDPWTERLNQRICGIILYLNDVHEGGGTYFRHQDAYVDARKGRVAIFPASWTHPHAGTIPISNDKYIISSFLVPTQIYEVPKN
jgi:hypothetical protein